MSESQPIETAPKDGTLIDVWCPAVGRVADVQWEPFVDDFARKVTIEGEPGWTHHPHSPPSHWMPLPDPPADAPSGVTATEGEADPG